jgi:hypothetical protein
MTDQIDRYLDGTLNGETLTPSQRADAKAAASAIDETRAFLAARAAPDLTAGIMRRIEEPGMPTCTPRDAALAGVARLLWTPRTIMLRPAYALMAIAAAVLMLSLIPTDWQPRANETLTATGPTAQVFVQFRLDAEAARVQLAGTFTNWEPRYELQETAPGLWSITVPLSEGVHDYAFIVDGQRWVPDPYAAQISDGFGGTNSRVTLLSIAAPRS